MVQGASTHASARARSRTDRIYLNQHAVEQLDRHMTCCALPWREDLSAHRAVLFSRRAPQRLPMHLRPIPDRAIRHEDFERRVRLEFGQRLRDHPEDWGVQKLGHLKAALRQAGLNLEGEWAGVPEAMTLEDRLGVALCFIRAFERGFATDVSSCLLRYPKIRDLVDNPYAFEGNVSAKLQRLRDHAMELARDHALDELGKSHADLTGTDAFTAAKARAKNNRLIFRLRPGRVSAVDCVLDEHGEARTTPEEMAATLRTHWGKVFQRRGVDDDMLAEWLDQDSDHRPLDQLGPFPPRSFRLKKKHIREAIRRSSCSSPGPDGLSFLAWRRIESLAVEVLHEVFGDICSEDGLRRLHEFAEDFNHSLLFFIPKGPPERLGSADMGHAVDKVRPLSVTNTDNRLLANAVRMVVEDAVAARISSSQRGFLPGRSMLSNLVDVEEGMAEHYVGAHGSMAAFFDFEVERKVCAKLFPGPRAWTIPDLMTQLRRMGFPRELMDIRCATIAAQARACHLEALTQGGLQVQARARRLRQLLQSDGRQFYSEAVEAWLASNTLFVLEASADRIDGEEFRRGLRLTHEFPTEDRPSLKAGWQASRCQFLLAARPPTKVEAFLRRRLDHWSIDLAPGRRVPRFSAYVALLGQSAPPCVMAAALRTACNGWLTTARFQQRSHCAFGCGGGFDCIRHYAHCGLYHRWCEEACALEPPPAQARLASFLGLHAPMGLEAAPVPRTSDEMRLLGAVCIYALYRAHLAVRHKAVFQFDAGHLFKAAVREACAREPLNGLLARSRRRRPGA
ncbi:unnamed protein product [Prorocentrum cordatum]|uniref:Reverse transcriptase domain-containing protein n=1 Tax=Prorocentrum cordatum TaxID=2364126 RepID=A0ABN9TR64_9DINO|nr:unnamed protein product [Polarella glacialis]